MARIELMSVGLLTWTDDLPNTMLELVRVSLEGISGRSYTPSVTFHVRRQWAANGTSNVIGHFENVFPLPRP